MDIGFGEWLVGNCVRLPFKGGLEPPAKEVRDSKSTLQCQKLELRSSSFGRPSAMPC